MPTETELFPLPLDRRAEEEEAVGGFEPVDFRMAVPSLEGPARGVAENDGAPMNVGFFAVLVGAMGVDWAEEGVEERAARVEDEGSRLEGSKEATRASMRGWWVQ